MNPRTTWILLALALGLGAFIRWYEHPREAARRATPAPVRALPAFDPAAVTSVEVQLRTNRLLRVQRTNSDWRLTLPAAYPANAARIEGLLPVFGQLNDQAHIAAADLLAQKQPLSAFGLDPPLATLTVYQNQNRWELKIGNRTLGGQQVYVQLVGAEGIYYPGAEFVDRLPRSLDDWRDPLLLRLKGVAFDRWEVRAGAIRYQIQLDPATSVWKIVAPLPLRANNLAVAQLLQKLRTWPVSQFLPEAPAAEPEALGLQPPEATLTFSQGTNEALTVHFGKSPTNDPALVYARCLSQPYAVLVPRAPLDDLRAPVNHLRENRLVSVSLAQVEQIEIRADGLQFSVQKATNGIWWVDGPPRVPADPELLRGFLGDIATVNIADFVRDVVTDFATTYNLNPPKRSYTFRGPPADARAATNQTIAQIQFGAEHDGRVYTRIDNEDSVYAVRAEMAARLPTRPFRLWHRQIWSFTTNQVVGLSIRDHGRTNGLARDPKGVWRLAQNSTTLEPVLASIADEALYRLGNLRAAAWVGEAGEVSASLGFPENDHRLTIEVRVGNTPEQLTLDLGGRTASGNLYGAAFCHGRRMLFEVPLVVCQTYLELLRHLPGMPAAPPPKP